MQIDLLRYLDRFTPISLEEMHQVHLMDRIDTKYVTSLSLLPRLLEKMTPYFRVQVNNQTPVASYATQYLDTADLNMFINHHNGKLGRQKIRIRTYQDSCISFLEVKNKNNKGRTKKIRIPVDHAHILSVDEQGEYRAFLNTQSLYQADTLSLSLSNNFKRITFVNNKLSERVTIDLNLHFLNNRTGVEHSLDNMVILELKQDGWQHSDFKDILLDLRIRRSAFSKYCMGTVLTNSVVKKNNFKKKVSYINKYYRYDSNRL